MPLPIHLIDRTLNQHNLNEIEARVRALQAAGAIVITITDADVRTAAVDLVAFQLGWDPSTVEPTLDRYLDKAPHPARSGREVRQRSPELGR